jgi:hypothetical protein
MGRRIVRVVDNHKRAQQWAGTLLIVAALIFVAFSDLLPLWAALPPAMAGAGFGMLMLVRAEDTETRKELRRKKTQQIEQQLDK